METRVAVIAIIVENLDSTDKLNSILHEYSSFIVGRMGIPYRQRKLNIISIVIDAPSDDINLITGQIGRLPGVTAKAAFSNIGG
ncbi:MAG: iron-only hydrogenase system regulator [Clostridiales bacterium]|nr:iron-only hydrogenase system regulator [Clostridiales bacterium]